MKNEEFIKAIKSFVRDSAISDAIENLIDPPGRRPAKELVELSNWYKSLTEIDKEMIQRVITSAVDTGIFGLLTVLDGVRVIEESSSGGFELNYVNDLKTERLNKPEDEYLHDIFRRETLSEQEYFVVLKTFVANVG